MPRLALVLDRIRRHLRRMPSGEPDRPGVAAARQAVETADRLWLMTKEHSLVTGSPESLMIEGKVNLLVSDNKWHVNPLTGKMELNIPLTYPVITGPAHIIPWIKLAIRKSHPLNDMDSASIIIYGDPFSLKLTYKNQDYHFSSIEKLMQFLKYN
jgi:iron complex transport system ATP-binding protein